MNLRVLKKDVDFLVDEFLSDALISLNFSQNENKKEKIIEVINEGINLRHDTYSKINHPDKENIKAYYRNTTESFLAALDGLCEKLSNIVAGKDEAAEKPVAEKKPAAKKPVAKKETEPAVEKPVTEKKPAAAKKPAAKKPVAEEN